MEPFRVLMVGPTGVGKRSTLASMIEPFQQEVNKLQYDTTIPDQLIDYHQHFLKVENNNDIFPQQGLTWGASQRTDYLFNLFSQTNEKDISIDFIEVCSGWFIPSTQGLPNAHYDEVKWILKESVASMWCIDCVSMIEGKNDPAYGDLHEIRNCPGIIAELYKKLDSIYPKHRLIFVLVRAETYLNRNGKGADWLLKKFNESYSSYFNEIKHRFPEMELYVVAIQTLGCFKFKSWQRNENGVLQATYIKFTPPGHYAPDNCETPALLVLDRALKEAVSYYEEKKQEIYDYFKKHYKGTLGCLIYKGLHIFGDSGKASRYAAIFKLLKAGKPILKEEFPKEYEEFPDINAHITLERVKKASESMERSVEQKQREDTATIL